MVNTEIGEISKHLIPVSDGFLGFAHGNFDEYCINFYCADMSSYPLKDSEYFSNLITISSNLKYRMEVYKDFNQIYNQVTKNWNQDVIVRLIPEIINRGYYSNCREIARTTYIILYMGMYAEEWKKNAILGKRIKRLGVVQTLFSDMSIDEIVNFSRGKSATELDLLCKEYKF